MVSPRIGFIGAGTLCKGLALALTQVGYQVVAVSSRSRSSAQNLAALLPSCDAKGDPQGVADASDLVFITTPDETIAPVAAHVEWRPGQGVVHCSGAESTDILEPATRADAVAGSFHPFQTFACVSTAEDAAGRIKGTAIAVEGSGWLLEYLTEAVGRLGARAVTVSPDDRAIYHAAAVMSCGYLVTLLSAAAQMLEATGLSREEALATILPLAGTTIGNVSSHGIDASVTGPVVRGDTRTLGRHLEGLESKLPHLVPLYSHLSLESLASVRGRMSESKAEETRQLIEEHMNHGHTSRLQG